MKSRTIGLNSVGFLLVTLAAYLSAVFSMGYMLKSISPAKTVVLIILAVLYLAIGIYGYASIRNSASLNSKLLYFAIQISLAAALLFIAKSPPLLIAMLPLAGQSVVLLSRRLMLLACAVMWLVFVVPMLIFGGLGPAMVLGMFFLAGIIFVVVVTQLAVKEQRARAEVERLLAELKEANEKLREYAGQVEELATVNERNRLAREIHDSLGHYLTVVIVQIEAAVALMKADPERSLDGLRKAQMLAQKGLDEVRRSVSALRSAAQEPRSLIDSMATLFEECLVSGVDTKFQVRGTPRKLSAPTELTLYRAAQEGLTNVRKHSRAEGATVTLDYSGETVWLVVHDEGIGATEPRKGFGLVGVHERVQLLGGEVRIATAADKGFTLEVGLPG
ncbi:MAG TPA: sensor histidine kinase [Pyrinomonadaceae bacterium]|nr:sensor histidine kinase [Pyrinomonadaceae bacterium]